MTATSLEARVGVDIPDPAPDHKCWAKAVDRLDPDRRDGHALLGQWLERGARYSLAPGTVVVTVDRHHHPDKNKDRVLLVLWRVDAQAQGGLVRLGQWQRWGHVGKAMLNQVAKALTEQSVPVPAQMQSRRLTPRPARPNTFPGRCHHCRAVVEPGQGLLIDHQGMRLVEHPDRCPPRPNTFPGRCHRCDQHVGAYSGLLEHHRQQGRRLMHAGTCPPRHAASTPNSETGPCAVCWQQVLPARGVLVGPPGTQQPLHEPQCPPNPYNPHATETWQVREPDPRPQVGYDYPAGTVARVATTAPVTGPGARELLDGAVSLIGVVVAVAPRHHTRDTHGHLVVERVGMWRPATEEEAAPVLRAELRKLVEAGLVAQARPLVTLLPGAPVLGATTPTAEELADTSLWTLPRVWLPAGAGRPDTTLLLDEQNRVVWSLVHNSARGDDWNLSNFGGYIAYHHPLTPERAELIADLRDHHTHL